MQNPATIPDKILRESLIEADLKEVWWLYEQTDVFWPLLRSEIDLRVVTFSKEKSAWIKNYLGSLITTIPCSECSKHLSEYIHSSPINVSSQIAFAKRVLWLHNQVNKRNGKKEWSLEKYTNKIYQEYHDYANTVLSQGDEGWQKEQSDTTEI